MNAYIPIGGKTTPVGSKMWPKFVFIAGEGLSNGVLMVNRDIGVYTGWFNPGYNTLFFVELSSPMHISDWAECT